MKTGLQGDPSADFVVEGGKKTTFGSATSIGSINAAVNPLDFRRQG